MNKPQQCTHFQRLNNTIKPHRLTFQYQTYSMYGPPAEPGAKAVIRDSDESVGLIPRAIKEIFDRLLASRDIIDFSVYCSFVQVYNENLFDMLRYVTVCSWVTIFRRSNRHLCIGVGILLWPLLWR